MKFKYDPFKDGVTQGLLTVFMRCREEARNVIQGLQEVRTSPALQFGSLAHEVLETTYGKFKTLPTEVEVLSVLKTVERKFMKEEGSRLSAEGLENLHTNLAIMSALLPSYFKFYKKDFTTQKWLELEQKFSVPSPVPGVNLVGRIDGAFNQKKELWLFESKTKSRIEEDALSDSLSFDFQNNVYQYALRHKYGRQPNGVLYNIIRRPGQKIKQGENMKTFAKRIQEMVQKEPDYYFIRFEVSVPRTELKRFEGELKTVIEEFVKWWKGEIGHYRSPGACMQKFGPCRFLPKCANNETGIYRTREFMFPELQD